MKNNDFLTIVHRISEILKDNETEKLKLLKKIEENKKGIRAAKKLISNELADNLIELLPDGFCKKLLQLEAYERAFLGGSNLMDYQKRGTLLRELIDSSIKIDPEKGPNVYVSKTFVYVSDYDIRSIGMVEYGKELNSLEAVVGEINKVFPCTLSAKSDGSPDRPSYQCFTIEFKQ